MASGRWVDIEDLIGLLTADPDTVTQFNDWLESEGFDRLDVEDFGPIQPHVHTEACGLLCATIQSYLKEMIEDVFEAKPLLWRLQP